MKKILRSIMACLTACALLFPSVTARITAEGENPARSEEIFQNVENMVSTFAAWKSPFVFETKVKAQNDPQGYINRTYLGRYFDETDHSRSGDYLRCHFLDSIPMNYELLSWDEVNRIYTYKVTVSMKFATSAAQEAVVDAEVKKVLDRLDVYTASDYQKIKAVYDWIEENVKYYDDNTSFTATAYSALIDKKAVCQGYAVLFYRFMHELGVECRVISGTGTFGKNSGGHAWNIVRLGGSFYNIDTTWAATAWDTKSYFLKGSSSFPGHDPFDQYKEASFVSSYPMSASDYKPTAADTAKTIHVRKVFLDKKTVTLKPGASVQLSASVSPAGAADKSLKWQSDDASVAVVDKNGKVTAKKNGFALISAVTNDGMRKAVCRVTVEHIPVELIALNKTELKLQRGQSETLTVSLLPADATDQTILWTSSDTQVAWVSDQGRIIADKAGTCTITAKSADSGLTAVCQVTVAEKEGTSPPAVMYRLYNPNSGEHFYTAKEKEKDALAKIGWTYEGIGWNAPGISDVPVYRMYNGNAGDHHYTMKAKERDALVKAGWTYEGIGWYSDEKEEVPLYREYNPNAYSCNHNYTTNRKEHDYLVGTLGWHDEGIGWYGIRE